MERNNIEELFEDIKHLKEKSDILDEVRDLLDERLGSNDNSGDMTLSEPETLSDVLIDTKFAYLKPLAKNIAKNLKKTGKSLKNKELAKLLKKEGFSDCGSHLVALGKYLVYEHKIEKNKIKRIVFYKA